MFDVGIKQAGASIVLATSNDQKHSPDNMTDGKDDTFWVTTGLFPQEFIMTFQSVMKINRINLASYNIERLRIEKSNEIEPTNFEHLCDKELTQTDGQLQIEEIDMKPNTDVQHLRFVIESGYDHFVSVHKLHIEGHAIHGSA